MGSQAAALAWLALCVCLCGVIGGGAGTRPTGLMGIPPSRSGGTKLHNIQRGNLMSSGDLGASLDMATVNAAKCTGDTSTGASCWVTNGATAAEERVSMSNFMQRSYEGINTLEDANIGITSQTQFFCNALTWDVFDSDNLPRYRVMFRCLNHSRWAASELQTACAPQCSGGSGRGVGENGFGCSVKCFRRPGTWIHDYNKRDIAILVEKRTVCLNTSHLQAEGHYNGPTEPNRLTCASYKRGELVKCENAILDANHNAENHQDRTNLVLPRDIAANCTNFRLLTAAEMADTSADGPCQSLMDNVMATPDGNSKGQARCDDFGTCCQASLGQVLGMM